MSQSVRKLLQGYMAKSWVEAMKRAGVKRPHQMAKTLQRSLWDIIFQQVWDTSNHILHHTPNLYRNAESTDLRERLRYYRDNKNALLNHHDQTAVDHSDEAIETMGRLTRRRWVKHLDKLSAQFQKERDNREAGQLSLPRLLRFESPVRKATTTAEPKTPGVPWCSSLVFPGVSPWCSLV
jgi:hypothetical protein